MNQNVVIIGASGHGKVIADIIEKSEDMVVCELPVRFLTQSKLHV